MYVVCQVVCISCNQHLWLWFIILLNIPSRFPNIGNIVFLGDLATTWKFTLLFVENHNMFIFEHWPYYSLGQSEGTWGLRKSFTIISYKINWKSILKLIIFFSKKYWWGRYDITWGCIWDTLNTKCASFSLSSFNIFNIILLENASYVYFASLNLLFTCLHKYWTGEIHPSLGNLQNLAHLDLGNNYLTGPIPTTLGNLTNLEILRLYTNNLTGKHVLICWVLVFSMILNLNFSIWQSCQTLISIEKWDL